MKNVFICALETGMRRGEILSLAWDQVDLVNGLIKLEPENCKNGEGRLVPISPALREVLAKLPKDTERVFTYKGNGFYCFQKSWVKAKKKAGIEDLTFHDLRHCFVVRMRRKGIDRSVTKAITGHKTDVCYYRYDNVNVEDLKAAVMDQTCHKYDTNHVL